MRKDTTDTPVPGQYFGYEYDQIGNRQKAQIGFDEMTYRYDGNALNQYTREIVPGLVPVFGEAALTATVKAVRGSDEVNYPPQFGLTPNRSGKYFSGLFPVDNTTGPVTLEYNVYAIQPDPSNPNRDLIRKEAQSYTVPAANRPFTYDDDGNMLTGHGWTYTWNGENRLIQAAKDNTVITFTYDYAGRRSLKSVSDATGTVTAQTVFVYSQFQLLEERDGLNGNALLRRYTWDPLLGSPASVYDATRDATYFYQTDANRNITSVVDGAGSAVAEYVYTPFGELLLSSGDYAAENPFRFSSEYYDSDLGLVYYNYRYYNPGLGRWLSRDPIGFSGGLNLYAMVGNNPVNWIDRMGLNPGMYLPNNGFGSTPNEPSFMLGLVLQGKSSEVVELLERENERTRIASEAVIGSSPIGVFAVNYKAARNADYSVWSASLFASHLAINPMTGLAEAIYGDVFSEPDDVGRRLSTEERWWRGTTSGLETIGTAVGVNKLLVCNPKAVSSVSRAGDELTDPVLKELLENANPGNGFKDVGHLNDANALNDVGPRLYEVGFYNRMSTNDKAPLHHVPGKRFMREFFSDHDYNYNKAPVIRVSREEHKALNAAQYTYNRENANLRSIFAQELKAMREHTSVPAKALREYMELFRKNYPNALLK